LKESAIPKPGKDFESFTWEGDNEMKKV